MASEIGICNSALTKIGVGAVGLITSLTEGSRNSNLCNEQYGKLRDQLLRAHKWNFATARIKLARLSETPVFEFDYVYQLPADWIRVVSVHDNSAGAGSVRYKIEGRRLLTNAGEVYLRYIHRVTDPNDMPADFRETLANLLAKDLASAVAQSNSLKEDMNEEYRRALRRARSTDAIEDVPEAMPDSSWISQRRTP